MKQALRKILYLFLFLFSLVFIDLHTTRGYFTSFFPVEQLTDDFKIEKTNMTYVIQKLDSGKWKLKIKNNDLAYRYVVSFRDMTNTFIEEKQGIFKIANLPEIIIDNQTTFKNYSPFGCGSGLGFTFIYPYEEFEYETDNIFEIIDYNVYNLCKDLESNDINTLPDSISIRLAIAINGYPGQAEKRLYSNKFSIPWKEWKRQCDKYKKEKRVLTIAKRHARGKSGYLLAYVLPTR